jgi:class 3 adenylate cyclase
VCRYGRRQPKWDVPQRIATKQPDSTQPLGPAEGRHGTGYVLAHQIEPADIRDFTGLAKHLGDELLSNVIGEYMRVAGQALDKAGATTQKYIGDALMGVWDHGPDAPSADPIRPPLACALRLFDIAAALQKRFGMDIAVKIGVGMNTGLAVLGNLGSRAASDYTALGETINKAFRLESASKDVPCDLVIGRSTWECIGADVQSGFSPYVVVLNGTSSPKTLMEQRVRLWQPRVCCLRIRRLIWEIKFHQLITQSSQGSVRYVMVRVLRLSAHSS